MKLFQSALLAAAILVAYPAARAQQPQPTVRGSFDEKPYLTPQKLVALSDGRKLNLYCSGSGSPTVILDAGFGNDSLIWRLLQPRLAAHTRVCSYDRAGERFSDPGPMPRDVSAMVNDLHALIQAAAIPKPYVLVGHSLGGMNAVLFADRFRNELSGLVLLDPGAMDTQQKFALLIHDSAPLLKNREHDRTCAQFAMRTDPRSQTLLTSNCIDDTDPGFSSALNNVQIRIDHHPWLWETLLSENENIFSTGDPTPADLELRAAQRSYGSLPLTVVTRNESPVPGFSAAISHQAWLINRQAHEKLAALSTQGKLVQITHSSHWVQLDQPEETARIIIDVVDQARANKKLGQP